MSEWIEGWWDEDDDRAKGPMKIDDPEYKFWDENRYYMENVSRSNNDLKSIKV